MTRISDGKARRLVIVTALVAACGTASVTAAAAQPLAKHATRTTVSAHPASVAAGAADTLTVTVGSATTPTGTVTFYDNGHKACAVKLSRGTAHCTVTLTAVGGYTIKAAYAGDASHLASSGTTHLTVTKDATKTTIAISPPSVGAGGTATLSARVLSAHGTPGGTVTFSASTGTLCTATLSGGQGSCGAALRSVGSYQVTGAYGGTARYSSSSGTASLGVTQDPTTTSVTASPASINAGTSTTLSATVSSANGTPGGTVSFTTGGSVLCTGPVSGGQASCSAKFVTAGTFSVTGTYDGSTNYAPSSATTTVTVVPVTTALYVCLTVGNNDKEMATPIIVSATLSNGALLVPISTDLSNSTYYNDGYTNCYSGAMWVLSLPQPVPTSELTGGLFTVLAPGDSWHGQFSVYADDSSRGLLLLMQTAANMYYNDTGNQDPCTAYIQAIPIAQYSFEFSAAGNVPAQTCGQDPGALVSIKSNANGAYVETNPSTTGAETGMLSAIASGVSWPASEWVYVALSDSFASGHYFALRSVANGLYASTEIGYTGDFYGMVRARAAVVGPWEEYLAHANSDGTISMQANANGDFVSTELGWSGWAYAMLRGRATTIGPWEKYNIAVI